MTALAHINGHKVLYSAEECTMRGRSSRKDNAEQCIFDMRREGWFFKRALLDPNDPDVLEMTFERPTK